MKSANNGFIWGHIEELRKQISEEKFENFSNLPTDDARVQFIFNVSSSFPAAFPVTSSIGSKNLQVALNFKNFGNQSFQNANWKDALECYSKSLIQMPTGDGEDVSVVLANRSAALYHLKNYKLCLEDISRALAYGYPVHLRHKVLERQARCYVALEDNPNALVSFKSLLQSLSLANIAYGKCAKLKKYAEDMLDYLEKQVEVLALKSNKHKNSKEPTEKPFISPALEYKYSEEEGRFAVAKSNIMVTDPILAETPHCSVLLEQFSQTHCEFCLKRVELVIPCRNCANVVYCSDDCKSKSENSFHKYECDHLSKIWISGIPVTYHLAMRMISQKTLGYFLKLRDELKTKIDPSDWNSFSNDDYRKVYGLLTHTSTRDPENLFQLAVIAKFLVKMLENSKYFEENSSPDARTFIGGLILHNIQLLEMNDHEIGEFRKAENEDTGRSIVIGDGLYPSLALFNHSCAPGIVRYYCGNTVHVHAIKNIKAGELIAENYGQIYTQTKRNERKSILKKQYKFDCQCAACINNWPLNKDMDTTVMRLKCAGASCTGIIIVPVDIKVFLVKCSECGEVTNIIKGLQALQETDTLYKTAINLYDSEHTKEALEKYVEMMIKLDENFAPPSRGLQVCQQGIRKYFLELGNK